MDGWRIFTDGRNVENMRREASEKKERAEEKITVNLFLQASLAVCCVEWKGKGAKEIGDKCKFRHINIKFLWFFICHEHF